MRYSRRRRFHGPGEMDVFVLGGLPLSAEFTIEEDDPSVGYVGGAAVEITLHDSRGKRALWAEKRMTKKDWDALQLYIEENYSPEPDYE